MLTDFWASKPLLQPATFGVKMVESTLSLTFSVIEAMQSCSKAAPISASFWKLANRDKDCCIFVMATIMIQHGSTWKLELLEANCD